MAGKVSRKHRGMGADLQADARRRSKAPKSALKASTGTKGTTRPSKRVLSKTMRAESDSEEKEPSAEMDKIEEQKSRPKSKQSDEGHNSPGSGSESSGDDEKDNSGANGSGLDGGEGGTAGNDDERLADFSSLVGIGEQSDVSDGDGPFETLDLSRLPGQVLSEVRNDEPALEKKLTDISVFANNGGKRSAGLPFWESLCVPMPLDQKLPDKLAMDDLKREEKFAELATAAAHEGLEMLRKQKVKFRRPTDYFAQMVKTDVQMGKVKAKILHHKEKIDSAEKRRNNRDISKNRKKVRSTQLQKEQDKKRKTKEEIEAFSRLRKQRLKQRAEAGDTGGAEEDDAFPIDLLEVEQLDNENTFRPQSEIAAGKRKAWSRQTDKFATGDNGTKGAGRQDGKRRLGERPSNGRDKSNGAKGAAGGVRKPKGSKKRLGRNRRKAGPK